jgi:hypothetical protein
MVGGGFTVFVPLTTSTAVALRLVETVADAVAVVENQQITSDVADAGQVTVGVEQDTV